MVPTNHPPELLNRGEIAQVQIHRLRLLIARVIGGNSFYAAKWRTADIDPGTLQELQDLDQFPFTTKEELTADQAAHPPYGSNLTFAPAEYCRLHQTSGTSGRPLRWLDTPESWNWFLDCWKQIYRFVGVTHQDRFAFPFSFGPFLGFWAAFEGATRLGNLCLPAGGMSSSARLRMFEENRVTIVCCTPTYALRLAEVAREENVDLQKGSVRALIVAGEPGGSIPAVRERIESAWGARVFDHWGMTEIGSLAIECGENPGGLHLLETECIAEILDPNSGKPVTPGVAGELVVTNLGRTGSPLFRYRTGDIVQKDTAHCSCGRQSLRLKGGVLGRIDDMIVVRGNNVYPSTLDEILRQFDGIAEYRIEVQTRRSMPHLRIEIEPTPTSAGGNAAQELVTAVLKALSSRLNFQPEVVAVPAGSLPRFELKGRRFIRGDRT